MQNNKRREIINWIALSILMIFYAGTWTFPAFYHVTEIYNTSIVFVALGILFINNVNLIKKIKEKDIMLLVLAAALVIALVNLFVIGSNKGCILILTDFLLVMYLAQNIVLSDIQKKTLEIFFLVMFASWFVYDRAFFYNANTGATVTVFTLLGGYILLEKLCLKKEIYGFFIVIALLRTVSLVLWHLARGAFLALFVFLIFYYIVPKKLWDKKMFRRAVTAFSVFGSLLFVAAYVGMSKLGSNPKMPFFYKNVFSGREQIWQEVWELFVTMPFTGIGSGRALKSFFEYNIHNSMYDILAVHGIIVFVLSICLILVTMFKAGDAAVKKRESFCAFVAVTAIFFESFIDMDLMWADYSPLLLFLLYEAFDGAAKADPGNAGSVRRIANERK
ncbi:MAG: O-antigen ligase family protein [Lachnospiraceae bacterium]|nr:O-antigen ligase family protein [Lachnospiraceae bacterium]